MESDNSNVNYTNQLNQQQHEQQQNTSNLNQQQQHQHQDFYLEPLNDTTLTQESIVGGGVEMDRVMNQSQTSSLLNRGRHSSSLDLNSNSNSQLNQDYSQQMQTQELYSTENNSNNTRMSREWSRERGEENTNNYNNINNQGPSNLNQNKRSSFFGLPELNSEEGNRVQNGEDYSQYRNENQEEGFSSSPLTYNRPSSFYGLEGPNQQPQASTSNYYPPPSVQNFNGSGGNSTAESISSTTNNNNNNNFTRETSKAPQYRNAPYAASRAASLYATSTHSPPSDSIVALPLLDHSHLQPGNLASLLSHEKTLDLYRANAKKTNDPDIQFEFCSFVMEVVSEMEETAEALALEESTSGGGGSSNQNQAKAKQMELVAESVALLNKLANRGHVKSQYFLADCYTQGVGTTKGKREYDKAYPLFVLAGKHGHIDACFRAAQCCENGWGCKKDFSKAVTFLRRAAALTHPGAMHRLGIAELNGELGLTKRPREGVKWLKRSAEIADQVDPPQPQSLHELAILHEKGIDNVVFKDEEYAAELLARAAELQYAPSAFKLGECYEYGKMGCPQDSALSIHYYNIAAQQDHREACFALTAWYLVGSPGVLPQSDTEAYLWARKAADMGLPKAEYAVGYFTEVGIGTPKDARDSIDWFRKAAEHGDKRAKDRLRATSSQPFSQYNNQAPARPQSQSQSPPPPQSTPPIDPYAQFYEPYSNNQAVTSNQNQKYLPTQNVLRRENIQTGPVSRTQRRMAKDVPSNSARPHSFDKQTLESAELNTYQPQQVANNYPIKPPNPRQRSYSQPDPVDPSTFHSNLPPQEDHRLRYPTYGEEQVQYRPFPNSQTFQPQTSSNQAKFLNNNSQQYQPQSLESPYSRLSISDDAPPPASILQNYGRPMPQGREIQNNSNFVQSQQRQQQRQQQQQQQFRPIQPGQIRMPDRRGIEDQPIGDKRVLQRGKKNAAEDKDCLIM